MQITPTGERKMKTTNLNKQITSLEKRLVEEVNKLENVFLQQLAHIRDLLQALKYKKVLLNRVKESDGSLETK
jgi:hypothetical protein